MFICTYVYEFAYMCFNTNKITNNINNIKYVEVHDKRKRKLNPLNFFIYNTKQKQT